MKKKILAICLVVALLATAIVGATLAYFTDTEDVTNTFTVGNVEIKLDEAEVEDGEPTGERTEAGNEYHLFPGQTYTKDPTVTVLSGSEECYVRLIVTVDPYENLQTAFPAAEYADYWEGNVFLLEKLVDWNKDSWECVSADDGVYEFRYKETVKKANADTELPPLFETITMPGKMTNGQIAALNGFEVDIVAHAIQAETFDDAAEAWGNFSTT